MLRTVVVVDRCACGRFAGSYCRECDEAVCATDARTCGRCAKLVCRRCASLCDNCQAVLCRGCSRGDACPDCGAVDASIALAEG